MLRYATSTSPSRSLRSLPSTNPSQQHSCSRHPRRWRSSWGIATNSRLSCAPKVDLVEVVERVTAAVKVTEDFYYATVYRGAMRTFRAEEVIDGINRKLDLMFRTYTMLADEVDIKKSLRLELIIVLLILEEIVIMVSASWCTESQRPVARWPDNTPKWWP